MQYTTHFHTLLQHTSAIRRPSVVEQMSHNTAASSALARKMSTRSSGACAWALSIRHDDISWPANGTHLVLCAARQANVSQAEVRPEARACSVPLSLARGVR
eukprot:scaffold34748_cov68-Phaeocystis_antarctica.AAC.8